VDPGFFASPVADLDAEARRQEQEVLATNGMFVQSSEGADPRIAPPVVHLLLWVSRPTVSASSPPMVPATRANEKNETYMWNAIFEDAAAWQVADLLQSIEDGVGGSSWRSRCRQR
jgi:fatty acid synthase subunit alpha